MEISAVKSPMLPKDHQKAVKLALELGRSGDPAQLPRLIRATHLPSNEIQRLAASGIGKLAEFGADPSVSVPRLAELALNGRHPQTQQYAIRALKKYGAALVPSASFRRKLQGKHTFYFFFEADSFIRASAISLRWIWLVPS